MTRRANKSIENVLISKTGDGDEKAFSELYELTHKKVYFYLFRLLQDEELAEDVLEEAYIEVWKNAKKFRGDSKGSTWITGIARNLAMNTLRKTKFHDDIDNYQHLSGEDSVNAESFDRHRVLKEAMGKISARHREILDLVFFQEFSYQEISEVLKIPVNTVKTRVFYAKDALKDMLAKMGVEKDGI